MWRQSFDDGASGCRCFAVRSNVSIDGGPSVRDTERRVDAGLVGDVVLIDTHFTASSNSKDSDSCRTCSRSKLFERFVAMS